MNKLVRMVLLLGVCLSLACGCSKHDKPMPLTKENITNYMQKIATAIKSTDPKEFEATKGNRNKLKQMYHKTYIEPLEKMGYSYDKTISVIANQVLLKTLRTSDSDMTMMFSDLLAFAKNSRATAYQFGFISKETKELLDQVSLIFPR